MPRFRLTSDTRSTDVDPADPAESFDDLHDHFDRRPPPRRSRRADLTGPRVVDQGRSGRILVDVDTIDPDGDVADPARYDTGDVDNTHDGAAIEESPYSSYDVAARGPDPVPDWLVTSLSARDTRLGVIKTGKEADVEPARPVAAGRAGMPAGGQDVPQRRPPDVPPRRRLQRGPPGPALPRDPGDGDADRVRP